METVLAAHPALAAASVQGLADPVREDGTANNRFTLPAQLELRGPAISYEITLEPASGFADQVVEAMRDRGVLLSKLGRHKNTLKIRPPMTFSEEHLGLLVQTLDDVLAELAPRS